ncbi:MAG: DoxX family membrane protein [Actinophytocola sp.]|uniref:DoxX family protein n=1 Tax=Actinophytocola sp. TaxID=1872138 RepID=UPI0013297B2E|nr:DoxX family protein [Actinophytocola sp.]MPZ82927.1 DoxX family membrane protein [Actinophytocola sp.]
MTATLHPTEATAATSATTPKLQAGVLGVTRVVVSFLFVCHGLVGLLGLFGGLDGRGGAAALGAWPGWWAAAVEVLAGALVGLGLLARPAAVLCSGAMAYAYFTVHQPDALLPIANHGEPAAMFCWVFLLYAVLGPGAFALDNLRSKRLSR